MEDNKKIKEAADELREMSEDYTLRRIAELREKGERDYNSAIDDAREDGKEEGKKEGIEVGIQEGLKKGRQENKKEIAKKLIERGMSIKEVEEITDLSKEEIEKLKS